MIDEFDVDAILTGALEEILDGKACRRCEQVKPLTEFYAYAKSLDGLNPKCKPCSREKAKTHYDKRRMTEDLLAYPNLEPSHALKRARQKRYEERHPERRQAMRLRTYALEPTDFAAIETLQRGRCAICGEEKRLTIDHDHATSKVRGLVCQGCNTALGFFESLGMEGVRAMIEYLTHPPLARVRVAEKMGRPA